MHDPRIERLAKTLVDHSVRPTAGENVLIEAFDLPETQLVESLVRRVAALGARPRVHLLDNRVQRALLQSAGDDTFDLMGRLDSAIMSEMQGYIGIRGAANTSETQDVPQDRMKAAQEKWRQPVHLEIRVPKTRWVVLRYPTPSMAQAAEMSTEAFEAYYFDVCTADYAAMARNQEPLVARMEAARDVRIVAPGTDLSFSIDGIPVVPCNGRRNIPDGEVFTAPLRESAEGTIRYNVDTRYQGQVFRDVQFTFKAGKIVEATCDGDDEALNQILDSDEGARYLGEWSLGCNNAVRRPMLDTLFDEKIGGSMHLTPGNAYETADNGNRSQVHWDIVLIQTADKGGGEVWFDGECIRRDGLFLPDDLQPLNAGLAAAT